MTAPDLLKEPQYEKELPKAIPIDQLQIFRLQGKLQLQPSTQPTSSLSEEDQIKQALSSLQSVLKESGQKVLVVTNKEKTSDPSQYFELALDAQILKLTQWNQLSKFETRYTFETLALTVNDNLVNSSEDLEKFANKIKSISTCMAEKKADVLGRMS